MITNSEIAILLRNKLQTEYKVDVFKFDAMPAWDGVSERIVIVPKTVVPGLKWNQCYVEINYLVPDLTGASIRQPNSKRIEKIEKQFSSFEMFGVYGGETYRTKIDSISVQCDQENKYHFVNLRILFEGINVLK